MAAEYDATEFIDTDFEAHKSPVLATSSADPLRAPTREEVDRKVVEAQQKLAELKRAQEDLERERAALMWSEATTNIRDGHVSDEVFEQARAQFSEQELADITLAVVAINGWNRLNIAFRTPAGTYQPGQLEKLKKSA